MKTTCTPHRLFNLFFCLLVFAGCTDCGQKTAPQAQKDTQGARSEPTLPPVAQQRQRTPAPTETEPGAPPPQTPPGNYMETEPAVPPPDWPEGFPLPDKLTAPYGYTFGINSRGFPLVKPNPSDGWGKRLNQRKNERRKQWQNGEISSEKRRGLYLQSEVAYLT